MEHLALRGVPQLVVGLGALQLRARVGDGPLVMRMLAEGAMRPVRRALNRVIQRIEMHEVDGQLAPGDELIEEVVFRRARSFRSLDRQRDRVRPDVSEVQIRRQPAGAVQFRLAVALWVMGQLMSHEVVQQTKRLAGSSAKGIHGRNRAVEALPVFGEIERAIVRQRVQATRLLPLDLCASDWLAQRGTPSAGA